MATSLGRTCRMASYWTLTLLCLRPRACLATWVRGCGGGRAPRLFPCSSSTVCCRVQAEFWLRELWPPFALQFPISS